MLALDPDAGEATHKTLQLFGRKHWRRSGVFAVVLHGAGSTRTIRPSGITTAASQAEERHGGGGDLPALTGPGSGLVYAAFEPLGFPGPDRELVFGGCEPPDVTVSPYGTSWHYRTEPRLPVLSGDPL